ncbi:hypothetical protein GGP85_002940 [Salinibacter ruber]|uniref:hypothetical protein n=1 Tax=Salinibacter ruber TaxID=146919 RepID=UPI00216796B4|nr:hypothetical protein [Salinibacter ruber]MCS3827470.1 hypothetical protein [Salinibacter ruber]
MLPADPVRRWLLGPGLAGLLLGLYFTAWGTTVRSAYIAHVARPVLETALPAPDAWTLHTAGNGRVVALRSASGDRTVSHTAPAGVRFLLPALFLAVVAPRRPYWLVLWAGHCGLALLSLAALALGLWGVAAGFAVHAVASRYLVDAFSLGVAVIGTVRVFGLGEGVSPPRASS